MPVGGRGRWFVGKFCWRTMDAEKAGEESGEQKKEGSKTCGWSGGKGRGLCMRVRCKVEGSRATQCDL